MENYAQVWVVDDDEYDQFFIKQAFHKVAPNLTLKVLYDGSQLVDCLQEVTQQPRLILLDLNMERVDGFEALQRLRALPAYQRLPVVILTTATIDVFKKHAFRLGANGFLIKPFGLDELEKLVRQLVQDWRIPVSAL